MIHNLVYMGYIWALFMELFQKMYFVFILFKNLLYLYSLNFIFVVLAGDIRDSIYIYNSVES